MTMTMQSDIDRDSLFGSLHDLSITDEETAVGNLLLSAQSEDTSFAAALAQGLTLLLQRPLSMVEHTHLDI